MPNGDGLRNSDICPHPDATVDQRGTGWSTRVEGYPKGDQRLLLWAPFADPHADPQRDS